MFSSTSCCSRGAVEVEGNGQRRLDNWFPTVVRYVGLGLAVYAVVVDRGEHPVLLTFAVGMIGFKSVWGKGPPDKER